MTALEHLKITDEIRILMARYVRYADMKQFENLASLFTRAGIFTALDTDGKPVMMMSGRDEIEARIATSVGEATAIHHLFSYEVEAVSMDHATGVFSMEDYVFRTAGQIPEDAGGNGFPAYRNMHGTGHYIGDYVRIENAWFISRLVQTRLRLDFTF